MFLKFEILSRFICLLDLGSAPFKSHHGFSISSSQSAPCLLGAKPNSDLHFYVLKVWCRLSQSWVILFGFLDLALAPFKTHHGLSISTVSQFSPLPLFHRQSLTLCYSYVVKVWCRLSQFWYKKYFHPATNHAKLWEKPGGIWAEWGVHFRGKPWPNSFTGRVFEGRPRTFRLKALL